MIDLYKKLVYFREIQILLLNKKMLFSSNDVNLKNYKVFEDEFWIFFIKIHNAQDINFCLEKYKHGLRDKKNSDFNPKESLTDIKNDFVGLLNNFYEYKDNEKSLLLSRYAKLKIVDIDFFKNVDVNNGIPEPPSTVPIHNELLQYGKISDEILQFINDYYKFLHDKIYGNIIKTIDSLFDKIAEDTPAEEKIETTFTVAELALLFRLLRDSRKLKPDNKRDLCQMISENFTSKSREQISVESLRNNFYTPDPNARGTMEGLLKEMQLILQRI